MHKASTTQVRRIILIQMLATLVISVFLLVFDKVYAWSSLAGGMTATLANAYFAWKVFAKQQESEPEQILATYFRAEVGKIILTVLLFIAAIKLIKPISIVTLMGVYLFNVMIPWLASFYLNDDRLNWRAKNVR